MLAIAVLRALVKVAWWLIAAALGVALGLLLCFLLLEAVSL